MCKVVMQSVRCEIEQLVLEFASCQQQICAICIDKTSDLCTMQHVYTAVGTYGGKSCF